MKKFGILVLFLGIFSVFAACSDGSSESSDGAALRDSALAGTHIGKEARVTAQVLV